MIDLHKAYQVLGLDPGTSLESVKRRYKRLVIVWHPDRMPNDAGRREAEDELKKINNAFELLKNHFDKHHATSHACDCHPQSAASSRSQQSSDRSSRQSTNAGSEGAKHRQEQEAKRREKERRQQQADEEASQSEASRKAEDQRRADDAAKHGTKEAVQQEQAIKDERLRWQAARAAGMACALILFFGWLGVTTRAAIGEIERQWTNLVQSANHSISSPMSNGNDVQPKAFLDADPH